MDLSRWNLAGQLAGLLELVVQDGLTDRVSPSSSLPQQFSQLTTISSRAAGGMLTSDYF